MGRVSRYKKIRSVDPFSKQRGGNVNYNTIGVWGLGVATVKTKKRSVTAQRLYETKINTNTKRNMKQSGAKSTSSDGKQQQQNNNNNNRKESKFGSSSYRHNFSSDEQPLQDEFDLKNLTGSLKKQSSPLEEFMLHTNSNTTTGSTAALVSASVESVVTTGTSTSPSLNHPIDSSKLPLLQLQNESSKTDIVDSNNIIISKALQREDDKMMKKLEQQVQQKHQKLISPGLKLLEVNDSTKTNKNELSNSDTTGTAATSTTTTTNICRKDGESMKDYRKRRQHEMKLLTSTSKVQLKRNLDKVARKKEFLTNKKKKRKNNKFLSSSTTNTNDDDDYDNYDDDDNYDNNDSEAITVEDTMNRSGPAFEQQVERPPIFRQLPRGAIEKKNSIVIGAAKTSTTKLSSSSSYSAAASGTRKQSDNEMEKLRLQVQAQYAIIRSQRQQQTNKNHNNSRLGRKSNNNNDSSSSSSSLRNGRIQYPGFLE